MLFPPFADEKLTGSVDLPAVTADPDGSLPERLAAILNIVGAGSNLARLTDKLWIVGQSIPQTIVTAPATAAWPAANDAIAIPFVPPRDMTVTAMIIQLHSTVSGNMDLGLYTSAGAKVRTTGATAQSGAASVRQRVALAVGNASLAGGDLYYAVMAMSGTSGGALRHAPAVGLAHAMGIAKQATAYPLPTSLTLATPTAAFVPVLILEEA